MDFKKLINVKSSPRYEFESFFNELIKEIEKTDSFQTQRQTVLTAISIFENEYPADPMLLPELEESKCYKDKNRLYDLIDYYLHKSKIKHGGIIPDFEPRNMSEENSLTNTNSNKKIKWKGGTTGLLELVYGLKYAELIEGPETMEEMRNEFANLFGIKLKEPDIQLSQMSERKSEHDPVTPFFLKINIGWKKYNQDKIEKSEKRK